MERKSLRKTLRPIYSRAKLVVERILNQLIAILYIGNRFSCPICAGYFRKMKWYTKSYYVKGRLVDHTTENAICPKCGSGIRHRFIMTFLLNNTNIPNSKIKLLHVAPEKMVFNFLKKIKSIEYIPCDIDPNPYIYPGEIKVDLTNIQFVDNSFDAILCIHVLEHIKNDRQALKELHRILRPGGWALVAVPVYGETSFEDSSLDFNGREKMYGIGDHVRMNGLDLELKLTEAGFQVDIYSTDNVPGTYIDRNVTSPYVNSDKYLFLCKK